MPSFEDRERGFESKFARDEELRFKATARRNKLIGVWAAEKIGKSGEEAELYAREVIRADLQEAGDEDVVRKIRADFDRSGVAVGDEQIRQKLQELLAEAVAQIEASR